MELKIGEEVVYFGKKGRIIKIKVCGIKKIDGKHEEILSIKLDLKNDKKTVK